MADRAILRRQANETYKIIAAEGIDPLGFRWEDRRSEGHAFTVSTLVRVPTEHYFNFDFWGDKHRVVLDRIK